MSPTLIHCGASGSSPNDKGDWTQTGWDKYCISREGGRKRRRSPETLSEGEIYWRKAKKTSIWRSTEWGRHGGWGAKLRLLQAKCRRPETATAGEAEFQSSAYFPCHVWPWQHPVFRSAGACFIIDSSQIHASFKSINSLKQAAIDETDWKFENLTWIIHSRCMF